MWNNLGIFLAVGLSLILIGIVSKIPTKHEQDVAFCAREGGLLVEKSRGSNYIDGTNIRLPDPLCLKPNSIINLPN